MDFFLDPRVIVPFVLGIIAFVGGYSSLTTKVQTQDDAKSREIKDIRDTMSAIVKQQVVHSVDIGKLQTDHKTQGEKLDDLVVQLREVVRDLQRVAILLASEGHGKTQG